MTKTLDTYAEHYDWSLEARAERGTVFSILPSRIVVLVANDRHVECSRCVAQRHSEGTFDDSTCGTMPACPGVAFVEDTEENRARLAVAILNEGKME